MNQQAEIVNGASSTPEDAAVAAEPNAELEGLATSVELTLASVLQGIALAMLVPKIVELLTSGELAKLPYIPAVMSWLSTKLDKPASRITQADVDQVVQGAG